MGFFGGQLTTWRLTSSEQADRKQRERDTERKQDRSPIFNDLVTEVTSNHFCHILFIRSKSLGSAHTRGRVGHEDTRGHEYQEMHPFRTTCHKSMDSILERVLAIATPSFKSPKVQKLWQQ